MTRPLLLKQRRRVVVTAINSLSRSVAHNGGDLELLPETVADAVQSVADARCGAWPQWLAEGLCVIAAMCFQQHSGSASGGSRGVGEAQVSHASIDDVTSKLRALAIRFLRTQSPDGLLMDEV